MKQDVPGFLITYPTASSRTMRTPCSANCRSQRVIRLRVAADVTSRSICSDQSAVPNEVQIRSSWPVSPMVTVENGAPGLRRKIIAMSASGGSPSGQTLSIVMNRSADDESRPCRRKSSNSSLWREMWLIIRSRSTSWCSAIRPMSSHVPKRGSMRS